MAGVLFLAAAALLTTELLARTKRPKRYAVLNAAAGIAALLTVSSVLEGAPQASWCTVGLSAVLGVPGAALSLLLPMLVEGGIA